MTLLPKWKNTKVEFLLKVALIGIVPSGVYAGVEKTDYQAARIFIITMRDLEKDTLKNIGWSESRLLAAGYRFYPEFTEGNLRDRICEIAIQHVGKGPGMDEQAALFSIGGMFGKNTAMGITKPAGGATTCILVARAVWHAAGINIIQKDTTFNVPKGLFATLPKNMFGYSEFKGGNLSELTVNKGDIFHIQGDNFDNGNDSSHVGIIINPIGESWSTVEGGSGNHITKSTMRKLVKVTTGKWAGRYTFEDDMNLTSAGIRPIVGWYSVSKIMTSRFIQPNAAVEQMKT
jgi:hypothetical protein